MVKYMTAHTCDSDKQIASNTIHESRSVRNDTITIGAIAVILYSTCDIIEPWCPRQQSSKNLKMVCVRKLLTLFNSGQNV